MYGLTMPDDFSGQIHFRFQSMEIPIIWTMEGYSGDMEGKEITGKRIQNKMKKYIHKNQKTVFREIIFIIHY